MARFVSRFPPPADPRATSPRPKFVIPTCCLVQLQAAWLAITDSNLTWKNGNARSVVEEKWKKSQCLFFNQADRSNEAFSTARVAVACAQCSRLTRTDCASRGCHSDYNGLGFAIMYVGFLHVDHRAAYRSAIWSAAGTAVAIVG